MKTQKPKDPSDLKYFLLRVRTNGEGYKLQVHLGDGCWEDVGRGIYGEEHKPCWVSQLRIKLTFSSRKAALQWARKAFGNAHSIHEEWFPG